MQKPKVAKLDVLPDYKRQKKKILFSQGTNVNYYNEKEFPFSNCNRKGKFSLSCGMLARVPINNESKSTSRIQWKYNVLLNWVAPW